MNDIDIKRKENRALFMCRKSFSIFSISLLLLFYLSCSDKNVQSEREHILFTPLSSDQTGIDFSNDIHYTKDLNIIEYLYYYNGGGVALGDINNDGLEDIYLTANQKPDKLFLNLGNLQFKDISDQSGLSSDSTWSSGVTIDDVNGDGYMDIYVCKVSMIANAKPNTHNLLYINNGDGSFEEKSEAMGLDFKGYSTQASFFDYDHDGDLDMYLLNHSVHSTNSYGKAEKRKTYDAKSGDILYENRLKEQGKFVDVSAQAGIYSSALGYGLAIITADINNDGWTDVYVGNDFHENDYLYINNQDGTFTESIGKWTNYTSQFTMGVDAIDMDQDGLTDIFTTDMMPYEAQILMKSGSDDTEQISRIKSDLGFHKQYARNHFHLNNFNTHFNEIAHMTNTYATDWSWSPLLQDFDNDGDIDIFITNGIIKRPNDLDYINYVNAVAAQDQNQNPDALNQSLIDQMPTLKLNNILFINQGDLTFTDVKDSYVGEPTYSSGAAYGDLDGDGDLDIVINNTNQAATIMRNNSEKDSLDQVSFQLVAQDHTTSKGSKVYVYAGPKVYVREYATTRGFQSASTHIIHIGLEKDVSMDSAFIVWPDGQRQAIDHVAHQGRNLIVKNDSGIAPSTHIYKQNVVTGDVKVLPVKHIEDEYRDLDREKLMPEILSKEGPAVVYEDFNKDGIKDLYLGGARNSPAQLLFGSGELSFTLQKVRDFELDKSHEDVSAAAIDFDKDGDLDLYVVSGGNQENELDKLLQDRLYINDGYGQFERVPLSLPHTNGGTVSVGDYNKDGYDDLFIGSRNIPGSYGLSPYGFILKNVAGRNIELVVKQRFGMVTDSEWIDINQDGFLDLVMTGDWMPITILINQGNDQFVNATSEYGLDHTNGFWNTIAFSDINQDGMPDIIAGNMGLNTALTASVDKPVKLYLDDFDENGQVDAVIFYHYFGSFMPFATKDVLTSQMPFIKKRFESYASFAKVNSLELLTGKSEETILQTLEIDELRSMLYLSGKEGYKGVPLNSSAQRSSIEDIFVQQDDYNKIIYFVGNSQNLSHQLGHQMSNSGGVLSSYNESTSAFDSYRDLPLSPSITPKHIVPINKGQFLIICNNGYQYIYAE